MKKYITSSEEETRKVGSLIAEDLKNGSVIMLQGDLGAGKTVIAGAIVKAVTKCNYTVTSPTFTIVNEYRGERNVNHFDLYRINSFEELENIGIYEYLYSDDICIFEWPERASEIFAGIQNLIKISINKINDKKREIIVE